MASSSAISTTTTTFRSKVVAVASGSDSTAHPLLPTIDAIRDSYGEVSVDCLNKFKNRLKRQILTQLCELRNSRRRSTGVVLVLKIRVSTQKVLSQEEWGVPPPPPSPAKEEEEDEQEQGACPICFGELKPRLECVSLRCSHRFHRDCLREWMFKSLTCPLCRGLATTGHG